MFGQVCVKTVISGLDIVLLRPEVSSSSLSLDLERPPMMLDQVEGRIHLEPTLSFFLGS
jgi:hypothetical protein